jgi:hypothetical protein
MAIAAALSLAAVSNLGVLDALNSELLPKLHAVKSVLTSCGLAGFR